MPTSNTLLLIVIAILVGMLLGLRRIFAMERSILRIEKAILRKRRR